MEDTLETISKKLSVLIALAIKSLPEGIDTKTGITLLDSYGFSNGEVASILGMKPGAVSMARSRMNEVKHGQAK